MTRAKAKAAPVLSAAAIFAAADRPVKDVQVPEWGGAIRLRQWSAADMQAYEASVPEDGDGLTGLAKALVLAAVDEQGQALFTDADIPALVEKSAKVLVRLGKIVLDMNAIGAEALETAKGN